MIQGVLLSVFYFLVNFGCILGADVYESINWVPQNPIFVGDGQNCVAGARTLKVELQSKVYFICPNTATVLHKSPVAVQRSSMYENVWLLYNKTAFDKCDVTLDPEKKRLLTCNTPVELTYSLVRFGEHTAEINGLTFKPGRTYYFIATSDGTESHINNTHGGHCADDINKVYMKLEVYVCKRSNQTYQDPNCTEPDDLGKIECPKPTPPTTMPTTKLPPYPTTSIASSQSSTTKHVSVRATKSSIRYTERTTPTTRLTRPGVTANKLSGVDSVKQSRGSDDVKRYREEADRWMIVAIAFIITSSLLGFSLFFCYINCRGVNKGSCWCKCFHKTSVFHNGTIKTKAARQESVVGVPNQGYINDKNSLSRDWSNGSSRLSTFYGGTFVEMEEEVMYDDVHSNRRTVSTSASDVGDLPEKDVNIVIQNTEVCYEEVEKGDGVKINPSMFPEASVNL